eukprot:SAG31_NODE_27510_length_425_cov_0.638037_1_plen_35_part_10
MEEAYTLAVQPSTRHAYRQLSYGCRPTAVQLSGLL